MESTFEKHPYNPLSQLEFVVHHAPDLIADELKRTKEVRGGSTWPECAATVLSSISTNLEIAHDSALIDDTRYEQLRSELRNLADENTAIKAQFPLAPPQAIRDAYLARVSHLLD